MVDALVIVIVTGFFAGCIALVRGAARIIGDTSDREQDGVTTAAGRCDDPTGLPEATDHDALAAPTGADPQPTSSAGPEAARR